MAIVKMSEFNLFVLNNNLESALNALQRFKEISFADGGYADVSGFYPVVSTYDYEATKEKMTQIQSVIRKVEEAKRKQSGKKGSLISKMNVKNMTFEEIESVIAETDLDEILETFSDLYERKREPVEGFKSFLPWEQAGRPLEILQHLDCKHAVIGTVPIQNERKLFEALKASKKHYFMTQRDEALAHAIFVILPEKGHDESLSIILETHDLTYRSAISLEITEAVCEMQHYVAQNIKKRESIKSRLHTIGPFEEILKIHYEYLSNESLKERTKEKFVQSEYVTCIRGWVESDRASEFITQLTSELNGLYDLEIQAAPKHAADVPIKLRNNRFNAAFEPITNMYSQPRYDELDPTPIFAPFYAFFFGMMLGDFGYGLLMAVSLGLALKFINFKSTTKGMIKLLFIVSFPTMFWGLIYGSFFGGLIPLHPIIDISYDFTTVLVMALGFGIFHLFTGMAVKAYIYIRDYKWRYVLYDVIFWYMTLLGAIVLVSTMFTDALGDYTSIATWVMGIGMVGIVLTNGRDAKTVGGKAASGLYSLYGLTGYVGDVVSYSRLMALGLAGASIGMAFNTMVEMLQGLGVFGSLFGVVVFMIGHSFNLLISGLSSYVHSARLTYVEFFGKFFVGGGKAFESFRAQPQYINVD